MFTSVDSRRLSQTKPFRAILCSHLFCRVLWRALPGFLSPVCHCSFVSAKDEVLGHWFPHCALGARCTCSLPDSSLQPVSQCGCGSVTLTLTNRLPNPPTLSFPWWNTSVLQAPRGQSGIQTGVGSTLVFFSSFCVSWRMMAQFFKVSCTVISLPNTAQNYLACAFKPQEGGAHGSSESERWPGVKVTPMLSLLRSKKFPE